MNILTERQRCRRYCATTHWKFHGFPDPGDARKCDHGKWWVATGYQVAGEYARLYEWRRATWLERRRALRIETQ